ncbi:MAG: hypothetical protein ACYCST_16645 [Acidimicrobiales bacterium]
MLVSVAVAMTVWTSGASASASSRVGRSSKSELIIADLAPFSGVVAVLSGQVMLGETDITNKKAEDITRSGVGYVPQVDDVFGPLSVKENLEMGGYLLPSS